MAEDVLRQMGTPDILVNNAGCMQGGTVESMTLERWNKVIETNLTGVFWTTRAFLAAMRARGRGDIFMINSMSGRKGDLGGGAYAASKFGLAGFAQSLMHEVRRDNIRVMTLHPSAVNTGEDDGPQGGPGVLLHAADIAETIVHLACLPGRTLVRELEFWGTNPF
jgi:3-oxoacyl-[acyl-carrier protein] reductase